ncbi:MAG: ThiF family adenylyltransferase [bacterium]|nr:ThiF family adenylyltransferase [bacterium]
MSQPLISRSHDLARLRYEGYDVAIVAGHLVVDQVPYLDSNAHVRRGTLVSVLDLNGDQTVAPESHVVYFRGDHPCDASGQPLAGTVIKQRHRELANGLEVDLELSRRPPGGYPDYYAKMTAYVEILGLHVPTVDPVATAKIHPVISGDPGESPFAYLDTASSRTGIAAISSRAEGMRIAIPGLGGTGSYILDFIAKCPVSEIHLYDGDVLLQHNAFRSPGALGIEELQVAGNKAEHFARIYRQIHQGVVAHPYAIDEENCSELTMMDFVFVAVDDNTSRADIVNFLKDSGVPCIDVGIGIQQRPRERGEVLGGSVRTTLVDNDPCRDYTIRIPSGGQDLQNEYTTNIQIAELNAINAALAVIRWKRHIGIYDDLVQERHSVYDIDGNFITNDDRVENSNEPFKD